ILIGGAVCSDGWASPSIGRSGACSHHGGVRTWPYVLIFFVSLVVSSWFHVRRSQGRESDPGDEARLPQPSLGTPATAPKAPTKTENPRCSRCRSNMVLRTASRGRNAGNKFWGCSRYPQCKGTKPFKAPEQQTCPNCGSSELAQVVYGFPDEEMFEKEQAGEIVLGGCIPEVWPPPRRCKQCGTDVPNSSDS